MSAKLFSRHPVPPKGATAWPTSCAVRTRWTATALERSHLLQPLGIAWLEEPLSQDDLKGYAELCPRSPVPIAAGECGVTRWDFEDLIECGLHVLQPDVAFCGGLTVCREVSRR